VCVKNVLWARGRDFSGKPARQIERDEIIAKAVKAAVQHMRMRPKTVKEVDTFLQRRGYDREVSDRALSICIDRGYIDDERYAELFVNDRLRNKPCARKLLRIELRNRGIRDDVVERTLSKCAFDEREAATELLQHKLSKMLSPTTPSDVRKLANFLLRRGFSTHIVMDLLREFTDVFES